MAGPQMTDATEHAFKAGSSFGIEWGARDSSQREGETDEQAKCDAWLAYKATVAPIREETARELLAVRDFLFACADEANRQRLKFMSAGNKLTARDLNSEANAYRNAAAMIEREGHASYRAAVLSALGPPPTEVREGVESTACPECGGSVFGAHVLDSKGQPVCGAMPATPPMRDREAIAACIYGHLFIRIASGSGGWGASWPLLPADNHYRRVCLETADAILSLSPPCDCLGVREDKA